MKQLLPGLVGIVVLAAAPAVLGSEIYVVRFDTPPVPVDPCTLLYYRDELVFYNTTQDVATVRLLGVSNGGSVDNPRDLVLQRQAAASSFGSEEVASWTPANNPSLWVTRLEVSAGVQVLSRLLVGTPPTPACTPPHAAVGFQKYAGGAMPVVNELTQAGVSQVHLATDLGADPFGRTTNARANVGIYNGGAELAHATVEMRRVCDGAIIASMAAAVPPDSVTQLNGLPSGADDCGASSANFEHYVIVTVDQPSFSYVVTLSNEQLPLTFIGTSP